MQRTSLQKALAGLAVVQKWLERTARARTLSPVDKANAGKHARDMRHHIRTLATLNMEYRGWPTRETWIVHTWLAEVEDFWHTEAKRELAKAPKNRKCIGRKPVWTPDTCARIMLSRRIASYVRQDVTSGLQIRSDMLSVALEQVDWLSLAASFLD